MAEQTEAHRATEAWPMVAWLGPRPPRKIQAAIEVMADFRLGEEPGAHLHVLWAEDGRVGPETVERSNIPTVVVFQERPGRGERQRWALAGATDVVSLSALPISLARRLKAVARQHGLRPPNMGVEEVPTEQLAVPGDFLAEPSVPLALEYTTGEHEQPGLDLPGPPAPEIQETEPLFVGPDDGLSPSPLFPLVNAPAEDEEAEEEPFLSAPPPRRNSFPPLEIADDARSVEALISEWVDALERYLHERARWLRRARAKLRNYLELCHLREQIPMGQAHRDTIDVFGQVKGREVPPLVWPVGVRFAEGDGPVQVARGKIMRVGTDGLVVELDFQVGPRQRLLIDLPIDELTNAQLMVESRWQRRLGLKKWQVGCLIIQMRRVELSFDES